VLVRKPLKLQLHTIEKFSRLPVLDTALPYPQLNSMMDVDRMRQLAGMQEARQVMDPDEEDRLDDERTQRERKISKLIAIAFRRIGLAIAEDGIFYQEDSDREAIVGLDDSRVNIALLTALSTTGLAKVYEIHATEFALEVVFSVDPALDNAIR